MHEGKSIPHFELTADEKTWLQEAWQLLLTNGVSPDYRTLRRNTLSKISPLFNPAGINKLLITGRTEITFLGVLHIDSESTVIKDADKILFLIKKKLVDADFQEAFKISELANELNIDGKYARIIFALLTEYGNIYNGATSKGEFRGKFDYDEYTIKGDEVLDAYLSFEGLEKKMGEYYQRTTYYASDPQLNLRTIGNRFLWIDQSGELQFNGQGILGHPLNNNRRFVDPTRVRELLLLESKDFDLLKLLNLIKEINFNFMVGNFYSVALLTRALIDHVPPIFGSSTFTQVANNYKSERNAQSFKKSMLHLENSLRSIGDSHIHSQVRRSEVAPNETQVD